ncbi:scaffoldin, partial [Piromyces sp. E2]
MLLNRLPLPCLVLLSLSSKVFGDTAVLPPCDNDVTTSTSAYCKGLTTAGFCLKGNNIYQLTAKVESRKREEGSCTAITEAGLNQYSTAGAKVTIAGKTTGLLYNCVAVTGKPANCTQITSGYYMNGNNLYSCTSGVCSAVTPTEGNYIASASDTTYKLYNYDGSKLTEKAESEVFEGYYLSADPSFKLIYCNSEKSCTPVEASDLTKSSYYVSGLDYDTGSVYGKLIYCNESGSCSAAAEVKAAAFYTNGNTTKKLIDCTSGTDKCKEASTVHPGYYLNGDGLDEAPVTSLFNCDSEGCRKATPTRAGYYLDGSGFISSGKYDKLIQCTPDGEACKFTSVASSAMPNADGDHFLLDGADASKVIKCTFESSNVCEEITGEAKAGYGYVDFGTTNNVIACTNSTCTSLTGGNAQSGTPAKNTGFLDAGKGNNASKNIIICVNSGACTSTPMPTSGTQGFAFLDGTSFDVTERTFSKIITCNATGSCTPLTTLPTYTSAEAYIDAGSGTGSPGSLTYANIITPVISGASITFSVVAGDQSNAYIDATDKKKIIKYDTNTMKSDTNKATATSNAFYINGLVPSEIIVCEKEDADCRKIVGSSETGVSKYYADVLTADGNIITCAGPTDDSPPTVSPCASAKHVGTTGSKDVFYVDGYTGGVLSCPKSAICTPVSPVNSNEGTAYINFDGKTVIQCTKSVSNNKRGKKTTSATDNKPEVTTITCTALEAITGNDTYYYIDASSTDKVIKCYKNSCDNSTAAKTDLAMAYINPNATNIIQCAGKVVNTKT